MQDRQGKELQKIEEIQRAQFVEFTNAWDMYMENYENAAYESLRNMRERHDYDIIEQR